MLKKWFHLFILNLVIIGCTPQITFIGENQPMAPPTPSTIVSIHKRPVYGTDIGYLFYALSAPDRSSTYSFIDNFAIPDSTLELYKELNNNGIFLYEGSNNSIYYWRDLKRINLNYVTGEAWVTLADNSEHDHTRLSRKNSSQSFEQWYVEDPDVQELNNYLIAIGKEPLSYGDEIKVYFLLISYVSGRPYHLTSFARYEKFILQ